MIIPLSVTGKNRHQYAHVLSLSKDIASLYQWQKYHILSDAVQKQLWIHVSDEASRAHAPAH